MKETRKILPAKDRNSLVSKSNSELEFTN